jgi:PleD family two-component response regulator
MIPSRDDPPTAIVQEADHALCQAKALGHNQYYISREN